MVLDLEGRLWAALKVCRCRWSLAGSARGCALISEWRLEIVGNICFCVWFECGSCRPSDIGILGQPPYSVLTVIRLTCLCLGFSSQGISLLDLGSSPNLQSAFPSLVSISSFRWDCTWLPISLTPTPISTQICDSPLRFQHRPVGCLSLFCSLCPSGSKRWT